MHSQQPPGVVQNWSTLQCSKQNTEQCGYDHAPVTRGRMRAQFPLPHGHFSVKCSFFVRDQIPLARTGMSMWRPVKAGWPGAALSSCSWGTQTAAPLEYQSGVSAFFVLACMGQGGTVQVRGTGLQYKQNIRIPQRGVTFPSPGGP